MIREYFVVARYLAKSENNNDPSNEIYNLLESDLNKLIKFDRQSELKDMFWIVPGDEITVEEYENE